MPIFEFVCNKCKAKFEVLVRNTNTKIKCENCGSVSVEKCFSVFGMKGGSKKAGGDGSSCGSCSSGSCSSCGH